MKQKIWLSDNTIWESQSEQDQDGEWFYITPEFFPPRNREFYPIRPRAVKIGAAPDVFILGEAANNTNSHAVKMGKDQQWFCANIMALSEYRHRMFNLDGTRTGLLTNDQHDHIARAYTGTYSAGVAFWNLMGSGYGYEPLQNWVTGENLDGELPGFDKIRTCGTNSHKGQIVGTNVLIDTWNVDNLPLDCDISILKDHRIVWATIIKNNDLKNPNYPDGSFPVYKFPRLTKDVPIPLVTKKDVYYPLYLTIKTTTRPKLYWP